MNNKYHATRLQAMPTSVIREMTRLAYAHKALNFSQGMPEIDPPEEVLIAANAALHNGRNQYAITWGVPELREALVHKYQRFYNLALSSEENVTITCGVTEAIIAVLLSVINEGDKVVILEPAHENYLPGISWTGGEAIWLPLHPPHFTWDEAELRAVFAQRPRAIILNTPHNPTGRVFTHAELSLIAELCQEYDVLAITDEIYEHIVFDGREHLLLSQFPGMAERTIITSGLSKAYAATGWRIGWVIAPLGLSTAIRKVHDYLTICAPTPLQVAAAVAVNLPDSFYQDVIAKYTLRRQQMMDILAMAGFRALPPEGAYYVMADYSAIQPDMDDVTFTRWLITEKRIAVVPGSSFFKEKGHGRLVRFAFPKTLETFAKARVLLGGDE